MASSIDFKGPQSIMAAYDMHAEKYGKVYYAVYQGRELKFTYTNGNIDEGADTLKKNLQFLQQSGTKAVFTIRFYDNAKNNKITNADAYIGSFTFQVNEDTWMQPYQQQQQPYQIGNAANNELLEEIKSMRLEMQQLRDNAVGNVEPPLEERIKSWLQIPLVEDIIRGVGKVMNIPIADPVYDESVNSLAGVDITQDQINDQANKASAAFKRLIVVDPNIGDHLLKLATLAETGYQH